VGVGEGGSVPKGEGEMFIGEGDGDISSSVVLSVSRMNDLRYSSVAQTPGHM
jgi:hypothetical protein